MTGTTTLLIASLLTTDPLYVDDVSLSELAASSFSFQPMQDDGTASGDEADPIADSMPAFDFGEQGSMRFQVQTGYGVSVKESNQEAFAGAGFSYFFAENLSVDLELNGWAFFQRGDDAAGLNFNLLFRWHFWDEGDWTVYVDGGAGMIVTSDKVPFNGTSFNFTPQAGLGVSFDLGDNRRLMIGGRWHHISNANVDRPNPGRDSVMGYIMLSVPWGADLF